MKAIYREHGDPPSLMTPARMNSRQGGIVLVELFAPEEFADLAVITTDWIGDGFKPVLNIHVVKFLLGTGDRLEMDLNVDLEEAFGEDNMTNGTLNLIVQDFKELTFKKLEERGL
jgi:hypothetical protein